MRKSVRSLILVILLYGFSEILSGGGLYVVGKVRNIKYEPVDAISTKHKTILRELIAGKGDYLEFSPALGWTIRKNGRSATCQANSSGMRGTREYELQRPAAVLRVATFGDSFTHGDAVANEETWQARIEQVDQGLEVMNFGVGGYGLDQAYLRYGLEGRHYKPQVVVIGFMTEDIFRNVNTYRPFFYPDTGLPLAKPRYIISGGKLSLLPNPMQSIDHYARLLLQPREVLSALGSNDYYYKHRYTSHPLDWSPTIRTAVMVRHEARKRLFDDVDVQSVDELYKADSEAARVTQLLFSSFYNDVLSNQSTPVIVIFPGEEDVRRFQNNRPKSYSSLLSFFTVKGYEYVDLTDTFKAALALHRGQDLFHADHYTPYANRLVADTIRRYLVDHAPRRSSTDRR